MEVKYPWMEWLENKPADIGNTLTIVDQGIIVQDDCKTASSYKQYTYHSGPRKKGTTVWGDCQTSQLT